MRERNRGGPGVEELKFFKVPTEKHSTCKLNRVALSGNKVQRVIKIKVIYYSCHSALFGLCSSHSLEGVKSRALVRHTEAEAGCGWCVSTPEQPSCLHEHETGPGTREPGQWLPLLGEAGHNLA